MAEPCRHKGSAIPWPSPQGHPLGQGTPYRVPDQPFLMIPFDVLTCLEGQTNSESYETRTVVSVSKIASQRFENRVDPTSVLREKPRKPKDAQRKARTDATRRSPELPSRGARPWSSAIAEPHKHNASAIGWPSPQGHPPGQGTP